MLGWKEADSLANTAPLLGNSERTLCDENGDTLKAYRLYSIQPPSQGAANKETH